MSDNTEEEVKDPQGLLKAYNKLRDDLREISTERDTIKTQLEEMSSDGFKARAIGAEARLALHRTGVKDIERVMKYINVDGIDFDDKGAVKGLDDKVNEIKKDLPEIFDVKRRVGGKADIHATNEVETKQNPLRDAVHNAFSA